MAQLARSRSPMRLSTHGPGGWVQTPPRDQPSERTTNGPAYLLDDRQDRGEKRPNASAGSVANGSGPAHSPSGREPYLQRYLWSGSSHLEG